MSRRDAVTVNAMSALVIIGILLTLWLLAKIIDIIVLLLVSVVFVTGVAPTVNRMERIHTRRRLHIPRSIAIILVYLLLFVVVGGIVWIISSALIHETALLIRNLPHYYSDLSEWLQDLHSRHPTLPNVAASLDKWIHQSGSWYGYVFGVAQRAFSLARAMAELAAVLFLSYYMLMAQEHIREGFLRFIPPKRRQEYSVTFSEMAGAMGGWLRGQVMLAVIIGMSIGIFMRLMGVPYALTIGMIGALAELAPMVGPIAAAVPAVLLSLLMPLWKIITIIAFFVVLEEVDGHYLTPKIMQGRTGIHPILTIVALLTGAVLKGAVGALLAIPITAAIQVLLVRIVFPAIEKAENGET